MELGIALALGKSVLIAYADPDVLRCPTPLDGALYFAEGVQHWIYYGTLQVHLLAAHLDRLLVAKLQEVERMITSPPIGEEDE